MSEGAPAPDRRVPLGRTLLLAALVAIVAVPAFVLFDPIVVAGAIIVAAGVYLLRGILFNWTNLLLLLIAVIMFIAIRRFRLPVDFPVALEPYRVLIVILLGAVLVALVADPRFRYRPIAFGIPFALLFGSAVVSIGVNAVSLVEQGLVPTALGGLIQLGLLASVFFIVRQLLTTARIVELVLVFLTWAGVAVAIGAIIERFLRVNVFLLLGNALPLVLMRDPEAGYRAGGGRAYASSQHPIALAVLLCILIPVAVYLAKHATTRSAASRHLAYTIAAGTLALGVLSSVSRTAAVVLAAMFLLTLVLRPRLGAVLGLFALPLALFGALLAPRVFDTIFLSFFDLDALIASQHTAVGLPGQGRLADLGPAFAEVAKSPFFGTGYGSRIVIGDEKNSFILDNQVLAWLMETGYIGLLGILAFMLLPLIRLIRFARRTDVLPQHAALAFTIAVSFCGYVAAMFFYDAFAFMQTFLVMCVLLAVGAWVLTETARVPRTPRTEVPLLSGRRAEASAR